MLQVKEQERKRADHLDRQEESDPPLPEVVQPIKEPVQGEIEVSDPQAVALVVLMMEAVAKGQDELGQGLALVGQDVR